MQSMNAIDEDWRKKCSTGPIHRKPTLTDTGLMLGRETILARTAHGAIDAAGVSVDSDEARVLAVLAAAYRRPVANHAIAKMRRASELWHEGEKALAQFHLAFIDLPDADEDTAYRLFLAMKILESGLSPEALMKALGIEWAALDLEKYDPDQPRVPAGSGHGSGQWTSGDTGSGIGSQGRLPRNRHIEIVPVRVAGAVRSDANPPTLVPGAQYAQVSPAPIVTREKIEDIIRKHGPSAPSDNGIFIEEYATE